jgi:SNF2 family DNA or RNA helicase
MEEDMFLALDKDWSANFEYETDFLETIAEKPITLDKKTLVATNAGAKYVMCRQMANGEVYANLDPNVKKAKCQERLRIPIHDAKLDALDILLSKLTNTPLLLAFQFAHDAFRIKERYPNVPIIASAQSGGMTPKQGIKAVEAWNAGEIPLLIGHAASMSRGLNMQGVPAHICWFGLTDNLLHYDQMNARLYRQGYAAPTLTIHRIIANDTIEQVIASYLEEKDAVQRSMLQLLRNYQLHDNS